MSAGAGQALPVTGWLGAVLAGCSLAFMGVAALAPRIAADTGLSREAVGVFSGIVWLSALLATLGTSRLVAAAGPWAVARLALVACAAGLLAVAAGEPALFWLGAACIGIGQGLEAPPASQLMGRHVPPARRPFYFSLKQMGVQAGAVTASLALPAIALLLGWRIALAAVAALLVALALMLAGAARRYAATSIASGGAPGTSGWIALLRRRPGLRRLALMGGCFGATQVCLNTFIVTWAVSERDASLQAAGALAATAQAAGLAGRPLWGWIAGRIGGATRVLRLLGILMASAGLLIGVAGASLPLPMLGLLAAAFGLSASGWNGVFLSEVASRSGEEGVAASTAAAMIPLYAGLIAGPIGFAAASHAAQMSTGFVLLSVLGVIGAALVPRAAD